MPKITALNPFESLKQMFVDRPFSEAYSNFFDKNYWNNNLTQYEVIRVDESQGSIYVYNRLNHSAWEFYGLEKKPINHNVYFTEHLTELATNELKRSKEIITTYLFEELKDQSIAIVYLKKLKTDFEKLLANLNFIEYAEKLTPLSDIFGELKVYLDEMIQLFNPATDTIATKRESVSKLDEKKVNNRRLIENIDFGYKNGDPFLEALYEFNVNGLGLIKTEKTSLRDFTFILKSKNEIDSASKIYFGLDNKQVTYILFNKLQPYFSALTTKNVEKSERFMTNAKSKPFNHKEFNRCQKDWGSPRCPKNKSQIDNNFAELMQKFPPL